MDIESPYWVTFPDADGKYPEIQGAHLGPRTKLTHPYSYDPILQYQHPNKSVKANGSLYTDRLMGWYEYTLLQSLMEKHFGNKNGNWSNRSVDAIQAFLQELMEKPDLQVVRIEEHCNQASGYPVWFISYKSA